MKIWHGMKRASFEPGQIWLFLEDDDSWHVIEIVPTEEDEARVQFKFLASSVGFWVGTTDPRSYPKDEWIQRHSTRLK